MADDLTSPGLVAGPGELPAPALTERPAPAPPPLVPQRSRLYTHRFGLAYAVLAMVVGLAVGGFIVLLGRATEPPGPQWSAWKPSDDGPQGALEIANHVSGAYKLSGGGRLVSVLAGTPNLQNVPIGHFALTKAAGGFDVFPAGNSIEYQLCGFGPGCAIKTGKPTLERGRLLHRQALELALYTFKYVHGTDSVLALLPPKKGARPTLALFFRKKDLNSDLSKPLDLTLPPRPALTPNDLTRDLARIAGLVRNHFFQYTFQQAQDRSLVLVLSPLRA